MKLGIKAGTYKTVDAAELPREAAYFRWRTEGKVGRNERNGTP